MADDDVCKTKMFVKRLNQIENRVGDDGGQSGGWLVKKHDLRFYYQGPCKSRPLDHSSAELSRIFILCSSQTDLIQFLHHSFPDLLFTPFCFLPKRKGHIVENGKRSK